LNRSHFQSYGYRKEVTDDATKIVLLDHHTTQMIKPRDEETTEINLSISGQQG